LGTRVRFLGRRWFRFLGDISRVHLPLVASSFAVGASRSQIRRRPVVLLELGLVEQRYQAVLEVLNDGAKVTGVARRTSAISLPTPNLPRTCGPMTAATVIRSGRVKEHRDPRA
jgi:hypothetical protein